MQDNVLRVETGICMKTLRPACFLLLVAIFLPMCGGGENGSALLRIEDRMYYVADFEEFLSYFRPSAGLPMEEDIISSYLSDFLEHKLLLNHVRQTFGDSFQEPATVGQELVMIQDLLNKTIFRKIVIDDTKLKSMYQEQFTEQQVEIQSVYYSDARQAEREAARLRRDPDSFENAMEKNNPEGMKDANLGQGVFSAAQLPDEWRGVIFSLEEPGIVGPIEIPNGFMIVKVVRFLDKPSFEEKREELELLYMTQNRDRVRSDLLNELKEETQYEFWPGRVFNDEKFTEKK